MLVKNALIVGNIYVLSARKRRVVFVYATDTFDYFGSTMEDINY